MAKIVLISCVKSKQPYKCTAETMYISPLFRGMLGYARQLNPDKIFILSAKYGLLKLADEIEPYEQTLATMKKVERQIWAQGVLTQLRDEADLLRDEFTFLAGAHYRSELVPHIRNVAVPMRGLGLGLQKQWLKRQRPQP